jgi:RNA polymerase sigma factor (sigma-70 family)
MADQPNSRPSAKQRRRNAQLLSDLLQREEHLLRRQATRHADEPDDVDDALQSAYALFLERFRGDCEPLAWLYTTVKREAWAMRRHTSRQRERSLVIDSGGRTIDLSETTPSDLPGPAERVRRDELVAERLQAFSELKPDERRALALLAVGLTYTEICELTGWTHTKVNRCISEGRSTLRSREQQR